MVVTRFPRSHGLVNLTIANTIIEKVVSYKYLGTWMDQSGDQTKELRSRIGIFKNEEIVH